MSGVKLMKFPAPYLRLHKRRRSEFSEVLLAFLNPLRKRSIWMHPRLFPWFDTTETHFTDEQWCKNFRVTRDTFAFLLNKIRTDISRIDTSMRTAVLANHRLTVTLYYLLSTTVQDHR